MKRDVYPVKVIKILPVPPEGPKPPFFKNPHRLAGLYANARGAMLRAVLRIRAGAGILAVRGRDGARAVWLTTAGRCRATVSRFKPSTPVASSQNPGQGSSRPELLRVRIFGASRARIRTLHERVQKRWAIKPVWTAAQIAMAARLLAWREIWQQRMRALEKAIVDRRRTFTQRWVHPVESPNPRDSARATNLDPVQERPTKTRHSELADLAVELAAVKADVAKHKEVIDDLTRKLAAAQGRGSQPVSPVTPAPKPPVPTKRNGHGEAKYHRS
jgi:hypothetical protein